MYVHKGSDMKWSGILLWPTVSDLAFFRNFELNYIKKNVLENTKSLSEADLEITINKPLP